MYKSKSIVIRIEPELKNRIESILSSLGMTTSQAVSVFFKQIEINQGLPFEITLKKPNKLTCETLEEELTGLKTYENTEELFKDLDS